MSFGSETKWIWGEGGVWDFAPQPRSAYRTCYFRRKFVCSDDSEQLSVKVSADSRYILYVNGKVAGRGPARGDIRHQFYDTYDLSGYLQPGENVLAAVVVSYSSV